MPSLSRRREEDHRSDRLESEVRQTELQDPAFRGKRKFMCSKCRHLYEERSRICPRCDSHTMGELKQIPKKNLDEARRRSFERARAGRGAQLWGE